MRLYYRYIFFFSLLGISIFIESCADRSHKFPTANFDEEVLYNILLLKEKNDIPSLKWYLMQIDSSKLSDDMQYVLQIENMLHFKKGDERFSRDSAISAFYDIVNYSLAEDFMNGGRAFTKFLELDSEILSNRTIRAYFQVTLIEYAFRLKIDFNYFLEYTYESNHFKKSNLDSYLSFINQFYIGKSYTQNFDYQTAQYEFQSLVSNIIRSKREYTYKNLVALSTLYILTNKLNSADTAGYYAYKTLFEETSTYNYLDEQISLLNSTMSFFEGKDNLNFREYYFDNCKLANSIQKDLMGVNFIPFEPKIDQINFKDLDFFSFDEYTNYAAELIKKGEPREAQNILETLYSSRDSLMINENAGYYLNMIKKYVELLKMKCENGSKKDCYLALEVLAKGEAILKNSTGMNDVNHFSEIVNEYGLAELEILYLLGEDDLKKVANIFYQSKNRFLIRNDKINTDNHLTIEQKQKLESLESIRLKYTLNISELPESVMLVSELHDKRRIANQNINTYRSVDINDIDLIEDGWENSINVSKELKENLYLDFIYDANYVYILSIINGSIQFYREPYSFLALDSFKRMVVDRHTNIDTLKVLGNKLFSDYISNTINDDIKSITICPSGIFNGFPFNALVNNDGEFLIEKYSINYVSNFSYYHVPKPLKYNTLTALPYTKPIDDLSDLTFYPLPFVRQEMNEMKASNSYKANILDRKNVSMKDIIKGLNNDIFHFSTHAMNNEFQKFGSYILYYSNKTDKKIFGYEIQAMSISAKLVVINGCKTDAGLNLSGEGVFSLTNSFLKAGVNTVITTTDVVNDQSSAVLISHFYKELASSNDPVLSLQKSQVSLINHNNFRHPYFWAAYRAYGG